MATKREFLVTLGLASAGRGKFSAKAHEALAEALAQGVVFDEPIVKVQKKVSLVKPAPVSTAPKPGPVTPTVVQTQVRPSQPSAQANPKAVRAWAKQNGYEVGERGRIHASVTSAFFAAGGKATVPTAKPVPTPNAMPKVRPQSVMYGLVRRGDLPKHISEPVLAITSCYSCKNRVGYCPCTSGPVLPKWAGGEAASTTKPIV